MFKTNKNHCLLFAIVMLLSLTSSFAAQSDNVYLSQLGFQPHEPKIFVTSEEAKSFKIYPVGSKRAIFRGKAIGPILDSSSGNDYWRGDFSALKKPGVYNLVIGKKTIGPIKIADNIWQSPQRLVLRSYYLQRCGVRLDDPETKIAHEACHLDDGILRHDDPFNQEDDEVDTVGGWHDAGDYGKYISPAGISVSVMLMAHELYPQTVASDHIGIPESGNGIPDLLDELRWKLQWMLKMQRPDGGVYHKIGGHVWPGGVLPEDDPMTPRYVYGVSTSATAKFAATLAYAARIYEPLDRAFSEEMQRAAEKAWEFIVNAPFHTDPMGQDNNGSGQYGDKSTRDDQFWAAVELFITTGKTNYQEYAIANIPSSCENPGWIDGSALALFHYATLYDDEAAQTMRNSIVNRAKNLVYKSSTSAFGITLNQDEFEWASNKTLMGWSIVLNLAHRFDPNHEYLRVADLQLHYIFGQNPMDISYVTGIGTNYVRAPHQRLHWSTGILPPGQMSGGPNNKAQSGIEPKNMGALSYIDDSRSYSSNEYAIDYNANLFFVLVAANSR